MKKPAYHDLAIRRLSAVPLPLVADTPAAQPSGGESLQEGFALGG